MLDELDKNLKFCEGTKETRNVECSKYEEQRKKLTSSVVAIILLLLYE